MVLQEHITGTHVTRKLDAQRQAKYFKDLDDAKKLINPAVDKYHPIIIDAIRVDLAQRGR